MKSGETDIYWYETYRSHVNCCLSLTPLIHRDSYWHLDVDKLIPIVECHDVGKLDPEFKTRLKFKNTDNWTRHEVLSFCIWLEDEAEDKPTKIDKIGALAILGHHKTAIDDRKAEEVERYISQMPNYLEVYNTWLSIYDRDIGEGEMVDHTLLESLKYTDALRAIDSTASFVEKTALYKYASEKGWYDGDIRKSMMEEAEGMGFYYAKELVPYDLHTDQIEIIDEHLLDGVLTICINLLGAETTLEYHREMRS
ncbi:MAG: hypothetical protein FFODKBPE_00237 [Candidatus Argoarchaeum ethanivorans]|uniref:Uncharacterized protein n=1 Tax=Candidatus Argoarchaeum ethanivorans TaxID=2608793 RepID=A0A811T8H2_9EURY|nr:MAG: hypothetical protein FFODKBPE_00237 [Candidatus Argoarchaeum ethanivorans]